MYTVSHSTEMCFGLAVNYDNCHAPRLEPMLLWGDPLFDFVDIMFLGRTSCEIMCTETFNRILERGHLSLYQRKNLINYK